MAQNRQIDRDVEAARKKMRSHPAPPAMPPGIEEKLASRARRFKELADATRVKGGRR